MHERADMSLGPCICQRPILALGACADEGGGPGEGADTGERGGCDGDPGDGDGDGGACERGP
ncbi:hypothetical protein [Enhygromyxa salina]|nr:hypothetical protein [Enhygromyxa salina]